MKKNLTDYIHPKYQIKKKTNNPPEKKRGLFEQKVEKKVGKKKN